MANVKVPKNTFVDLLAASGIVAGTLVEIVPLNTNYVQIYNTELEPELNVDSYLPCLWPNKVLGQATDAGLWAYSNVGGIVDIREVS